MLTNIGIPGLVLILVIALVIFGPKKLPEVGRSFGQTIKEFKKSTKELTSEVTEPIDDLKKEAKKLTDPEIEDRKTKADTTDKSEKTDK